MALRVLLADNSETIKKVIQLSLQDYATQVRSVNIGIDVVDVAKSFQPDIIFADILLQKRNGYDVCLDIKNTPELAKIPVVLIWSGFMDLDQQKFTESRADASLEKPFDSEDLRKLIQKFVPKVQNQTLSEFLETPVFARTDYKLEPQVRETLADLDGPTIAGPAPTGIPSAPKPLSATAPTSSPTTPNAPEAEWNMDSFDDINDFQLVDEKKALPDLQLQTESTDEFAQVPINKVNLSSEAKSSSKTNPTEKQDVMSSQKPNEFELDVPDETDFEGVTVSIVIPQDEITNVDFLDKTKSSPQAPQETPKAEPAKPAQQTAAPPKNTAIDIPNPAPSAPTLTEEQLEELLRNYSREVIEKIVWKLVPDMAERIIREEIKRLLDEPEMKA